MSPRIRRRRSRDLREGVALWDRERDWQLAQAHAGGLGTRPLGWWQNESRRPDLAAGSGLDAYAHLEGNPQADRAAERLRYLAASRELTDGERAAITAGGDESHVWRRAILGDVDHRQA